MSPNTTPSSDGEKRCLRHDCSTSVVPGSIWCWAHPSTAPKVKKSKVRKSFQVAKSPKEIHSE
jgi:hypothetical protein